MKTPFDSEIFVFDNKGKTIDRFTIVFKEPFTGSLYGCSENPFHPLGFGQYCGDIDPAELNEFSYENVNEYITEARLKPSWLGKEIKRFSTLPVEVQKYIKQLSE